MLVKAQANVTRDAVPKFLAEFDKRLFETSIRNLQSAEKEN